MLRSIATSVAVLVLVAGCGGEQPHPQVTFAAGAATAVADPARYCDVELTECSTDEAAPVQLAVPAGASLEVRVPPEIAETPWQVAFTYADAAGTRTDHRSPVFAPDERNTWTLEPASPTDRLLAAEVQQYGPPPQANPETGGIEFPIRASWVLRPTN